MTSPLAADPSERAAVEAAVLDLASVFAETIGAVWAVELARNLAQTILSMQDAGEAVVIVCDVIRSVLEDRRRNWRNDGSAPWRSLTDTQVEVFAVKGAFKWNRAVRLQHRARAVAERRIPRAAGCWS